MNGMGIRRRTGRRVRGRDERGQSVVEFALILPFMLLLVLGVVDYSRVYYMDVQVLQAARNGAAFASASNTNANNQLGVHNSSLQNVDLPNNTNVNENVVNDNSGGQSVQVTVEAQFNTLVNWPGLPHSFMLRRTVEAKVLQ